jgi:hypothetical protein
VSRAARTSVGEGLVDNAAGQLAPAQDKAARYPVDDNLVLFDVEVQQ